VTTLDATTTRVAVIGDVGGHLAALSAELARLGAADDGRGPLPDDLVVVQVGDLVHRGPDSDAVIELVDSHLTRQPDQWVQLLGNHEAQYLRAPAFEWPQRLGRDAAAALRRWYARGLFRAGVGLQAGSESLLVTHAGVTRPFWEQSLAAPDSVDDAVLRLDRMLEDDDSALFRPGVMLTPRGVDTRSGPLWASADEELLPSWLGHELPFSQVHGHSSLVDWDRGRLRVPGPVGRTTTVDEDAKHESTELAGGRIVGIDPCHGASPRPTWRAWEVGRSSPL